MPQRDKNLLLKESVVLFKDNLTRQRFEQAFKYTGDNIPRTLKTQCEFGDLWMAKREQSCGLPAWHRLGECGKGQAVTSHAESQLELVAVCVVPLDAETRA